MSEMQTSEQSTQSNEQSTVQTTPSTEQTTQAQEQTQESPSRLPAIVLKPRTELPKIVLKNPGKSSGRTTRSRTTKPLLNNDNLYLLLVKSQETEKEYMFQSASSSAVCNYLLRQCNDDPDSEYGKLVTSLLQEGDETGEMTADDLRARIDASSHVSISRYEVDEIIRL